MNTNGSVAHGLPGPWSGLVAIVAGLLGMSVAAALAQPYGIRATLVVGELALAAPAAMVLWLLGRIGPPTTGPRPLLLSLGAGIGLWIASLGLMAIQQDVWPPPESLLEMFRQLHVALRPRGPLDAVLSWIAIAAAPAVCEETLFRGVTLPAFIRRLGPVGAVLLSAVLFGAIHVGPLELGPGSLYRVPFTILAGIGFGALRLCSGSLAAPIVAHGALNTITLMIVPITDEPEASVPLAFGVLLLVIGSTLAVMLTRAVARSVRT
jgi:membrane protease YdiL (CAAX protease family)